MFLEQIEKNKLEAFKHLVEIKGRDKETVFINNEGYYCYKTKRGKLKIFVSFNSFNEYKKSAFYTKK